MYYQHVCIFWVMIHHKVLMCSIAKFVWIVKKGKFHGLSISTDKICHQRYSKLKNQMWPKFTAKMTKWRYVVNVTNYFTSNYFPITPEQTWHTKRNFLRAQPITCLWSSMITLTKNSIAKNAWDKMPISPNKIFSQLKRYIMIFSKTSRTKLILKIIFLA